MLACLQFFDVACTTGYAARVAAHRPPGLWVPKIWMEVGRTAHCKNSEPGQVGPYNAQGPSIFLQAPV